MATYGGYLKDKDGNKILTIPHYQIGDIIITSTNDNPSNILGGTWQLTRTVYGGELVAFGIVQAEGGSTKKCLKDNYYPFSDDGILGTSKSYNVTNYVDGILTGNSGTIYVNTQGVVGLVECDVFISGLSQDTSSYGGIRWGNNSNPLPDSVTLFPVGRKPLTLGWSGGGYGGTYMRYTYKVNSSSNEKFFVNPSFAPYNHNLTTNAGGVGSYLIVKAYAKYEPSYLWKRIS